MAVLLCHGKVQPKSNSLMRKRNIPVDIGLFRWSSYSKLMETPSNLVSKGSVPIDIVLLVSSSQSIYMETHLP